jgi:hypothetical protein
MHIMGTSWTFLQKLSSRNLQHNNRIPTLQNCLRLITFFSFEAQEQTWPEKLLAPPKSSSLAECRHEFHLHSTGFQLRTFFWGFRVLKWAIPVSHHRWGKFSDFDEQTLAWIDYLINTSVLSQGFTEWHIRDSLQSWLILNFYEEPPVLVLWFC